MDKRRILEVGARMDKINKELDEMELGAKAAQALIREYDRLAAEYDELIKINLPADFPTVGREPGDD